MLAVEGLRAWYGAAQILFDLSFEVASGEVVALMGRNGAGKTTTLRALMGLMAQRSGTIRFLGEDISRLKPFEIAEGAERVEQIARQHPAIVDEQPSPAVLRTHAE